MSGKNVIDSIRLSGIISSLSMMTEEGLIAVLNALSAELAKRKLNNLRGNNKGGKINEDDKN